MPSDSVCSKPIPGCWKSTRSWFSSFGTRTAKPRLNVLKHAQIHCLEIFKNKVETKGLNLKVLVNYWRNKQMYTFPPLLLVQVTLQHIHTKQTVLLIVSLLNWPWILIMLLLGALTHSKSNLIYCPRREIMALGITSAYWQVHKGSKTLLLVVMLHLRTSCIQACSKVFSGWGRNNRHYRLFLHCREFFFFK